MIDGKKGGRVTKAIRCTEAQEAWDFEVDSNCDFVARAETEDEALAEITNHMQTVHNWNELYEQDLEKARTLTIHDE
jgi:predicted small metal-binding protein